MFACESNLSVRSLCLSNHSEGMAERNFDRRTLHVLATRGAIVVLYAAYNAYSFYAFVGTIVNVVHGFRGDDRRCRAASGGPFTLCAPSSRERMLRFWLIIFVGLVNNFAIWASMIPFVVVCCFWKLEPDLYLPDVERDRAKWPTVDILLPRYKEPWQEFEKTLSAVCRCTKFREKEEDENDDAAQRSELSGALPHRFSYVHASRTWKDTSRAAFPKSNKVSPEVGRAAVHTVTKRERATGEGKGSANQTDIGFLLRYDSMTKRLLDNVDGAFCYPAEKLNVFVCDDGGNDPSCTIRHHVSEFRHKLLKLYSGTSAVELPRVHYIAREYNADAKAGNLNFGLRQGHGKLVCVFDADHKARPDFLLRTIPHFREECDSRAHCLEEAASNSSNAAVKKTGFVQTKQYFYNDKSWLVWMLGEDNKFYGFLYQLGLGGLGVPCCVGTGYVAKRKALEEVGGYVTGFVVEDCFTSCRLAKRGWRGKYLPGCHAVGEAPPGLAEFIQQRWRWSIGNVQMILYDDFLRSDALSIVQKIGILGGNWYVFSMASIFLTILLRLYCFVTFLLVHDGSLRIGESVSQIVIQWLSFCFMFSLPCVSLLGKVTEVMSLMCLVPVFIAVTGYALLGRLDPKRGKLPRVKAASETVGTKTLPPIVLGACLALTGLIALAFLLLMLPGADGSREQEHGLKYVVLLTNVAPLFLSVLPVYVVVIHRSLESCRTMTRSAFEFLRKVDAYTAYFGVRTYADQKGDIP